MELILTIKALAGISVTVPFGGKQECFPPGVVGHSLLPVFLCTLGVFITDYTYVLTLSFSRLHEHVVRQLIYSITSFRLGISYKQKIYILVWYVYKLLVLLVHWTHTHTLYTINTEEANNENANEHME